MATFPILATALLTLTLTLTIQILPTTFADPAILTDFVVPKNMDPTQISGQFFTFTNFRNVGANLTSQVALVTKGSKKEFPALDGESVSSAHLLFPPSGINPPHLHPRASEILIVIEGTLEVGLVDSTGKLYTQTLQTYDQFLFPKGLIHYQVNPGQAKAVAIGFFGSSNAGTVSIGATMFGSGINQQILAKAFKTDENTVSKIVAAFKK